MKITSTTALLRAIAYMAASVQFVILTFLYYWGYRNVKTSKIIKTLTCLFFWFACLFLILSYMTIFKVLGLQISTKVAEILFIPMFAIVFYASRFIEHSLKDDLVGGD